MMATLIPQPTVAQLTEQVARLQAENHRVKAAYNQLQEKHQHLQARLEWEKRLFSNAAYSPSEKLVLWAARPIVEETAKNADGLAHVPLMRVSEDVGLSTATVGRAYLALAKNTADLQRREEPVETDLGTRQTKVLLAFSDQLKARPDTTTRYQERQWGGKREKRCSNPTCQSANLVEESYVVCRDCGCVQGPKKQRAVNGSPHIHEEVSPLVMEEPTAVPLVGRVDVVEEEEEEPLQALLPAPTMRYVEEVVERAALSTGDDVPRAGRSLAAVPQDGSRRLRQEEPLVEEASAEHEEESATSQAEEELAVPFASERGKAIRATTRTLLHGDRVLTPYGRGVVQTSRYCDILKRDRCSVLLDVPHGEWRYHIFDGEEVSRVEQGSLFDPLELELLAELDET